MRAGARIAGRWELVEELPGTDATWRWRCRDLQDGPDAEVIGLRARALLWPGAREGFMAADPGEAAAALPILARDVLDGVPVRVRPATRGPLAHVPLGQVGAVAGWLGDAIVRAPGGCGGHLHGEDVVVDHAGVPRLAPLGVPPPPGLGRVHTGRAPEGTDGAASALHGLGVLLTTLATGRPLLPHAPSLPQTGDHDADAVLAALLAASPADRHAPSPPDAPPVLARDATPAVAGDGSPDATTAPHGALVRPRPSLPARGAAGIFPRHVVLVQTARLSAGALARLAVRSGASPEAVLAAHRDGTDWAVAGYAIEADARTLLRRLGAVGLPADVRPTRPPGVIQYVLSALVAFVVGFLVNQTLIGSAIAALLTWMAFTNFRAMFVTARTRMAWTARERGGVEASTLEGRLAQVRERVGRADLADAVESDLLARADDLLLDIEQLRVTTAEARVLDGTRTAPEDRVTALESRVSALERDLRGLANV